MDCSGRSTQTRRSVPPLAEAEVEERAVDETEAAMVRTGGAMMPVPKAGAVLMVKKRRFAEASMA